MNDPRLTTACEVFDNLGRWTTVPEARLVAELGLQNQSDEKIESVMMSLQTDQDLAIRVVPQDPTKDPYWRPRELWDTYRAPQRRKPAPPIGGPIGARSKIGGPVGSGRRSSFGRSR